MSSNFLRLPLGGAAAAFGAKMAANFLRLPADGAAVAKMASGYLDRPLGGAAAMSGTKMAAFSIPPQGVVSGTLRVGVFECRPSHCLYEIEIATGFPVPLFRRDGQEVDGLAAP